MEAGVIRTKTSQAIPLRLAKIHQGLIDVIDRVDPDCVAIEAIFRHKSSESALRLGQARGVALLAAAQRDLDVTDYNPMTVKKSIGGHGRAGKHDLVLLVARLLGLAKPLPSDASDAAAIAMTHHSHYRLSQRLVAL